VVFEVLQSSLIRDRHNGLFWDHSTRDLFPLPLQQQQQQTLKHVRTRTVQIKRRVSMQKHRVRNRVWDTHTHTHISVFRLGILPTSSNFTRELTFTYALHGLPPGLCRFLPLITGTKQGIC
jgi:hypothetical protein